MIKTICNKCKRLNLVKLNIQGAGRIQMPCQYCNNKMTFDTKKTIPIKKEIKDNENKS
jgi:RNase P subunit RPR2